MTAQRRDLHSTEFGLWLREQPELDSERGYLATNVDFVWRNYKTGDWMFLEEKRYGSKPRRWQREIFNLLHRLASADARYRGFHLLVFEKASPDDGTMTLDGAPIDRVGLIQFLRDFQRPEHE